MKETEKLVEALKEFYGNEHMGLASQLGYLIGVLKSLEAEYKSCGDFIEYHTAHLLKQKKKWREQ